MDVSRLQLLAVLVTAGLFVLVFELVRRRRLLERYALLWLFSSAVLLVPVDLARAARGARGGGRHLLRAVGAVRGRVRLRAVLLLHFSLVISRLAEQTKVLAQRMGLLQHEVDELRSRPRTTPRRPRTERRRAHARRR